VDVEGGREGREDDGGGGEVGIRDGGSRTHRPDPRPVRPRVDGTEANQEGGEDNQGEVQAIQKVDVHLHVEDMVEIRVEVLWANLEDAGDSHEVDNQEEVPDVHHHVEDMQDVEDMEDIRVEGDVHLHVEDMEVEDNEANPGEGDGHGEDSQEGEGHTLHPFL